MLTFGGGVEQVRRTRKWPGRGEVLDGRRHPESLEVVGHRAPPGLAGVRLGVRVGGRRPRVDAPVVEHPRHVVDPPRPLRHAQDQVVVLAAVEARPEAADVLDQRLRRSTDRWVQ